jgi:hypothetical protein
MAGNPMNRLMMIVSAVALGFAPVAAQASVSVSGVGFVHFRYQLETDSSLIPASAQNNFDVDRSYVTLDAVDDAVSARITADIDGRSSSSALQFRLKYAYARWRPAGGSIAISAGMIPTPLVGYVERLWDYRAQGRVAMDRSGYLTSSDIGASVDAAWSGDRIQLAAGVFNGEGYQNEPGDHRKDAAARASVRLMSSDTVSSTSGLRLTGFGHYGKPTGGGIRARWLAMVSWQSRRLTVAVEHARTTDSTAVDASTTNGSVTSVWGTWRPRDSRLEAIARVDLVDRDVDFTPSVPDPDTDLNTSMIVGLSYRVSPMLRVMADADLLSLEQGSPGNEFDSTRRSISLRAEFRF